MCASAHGRRNNIEKRSSRVSKRRRELDVVATTKTPGGQVIDWEDSDSVHLYALERAVRRRVRLRRMVQHVDVSGWVQYDNVIFPKTTFAPLSTSRGAQQMIHIKVQLWRGNWWIRVQGRWMGYLPCHRTSSGE
jgi:hypothetical protein